MPAPDQLLIDAEITRLEDLKTTVRKHNGFGENNHDAIDAQITVLRESMDDESLIYAAFEDEEDPENRHDLDAALEAGRWLRGETAEAPSNSWLTAKL